MERAKDPNFTVNPDAEMTMMNALDITINDQSNNRTNTPISNQHTPAKTNEPSATEQRTVNISESQIGLAQEESRTTNRAPEDLFDSLTTAGEHQSEDGLWLKANGMMADIDDIGVKLKTDMMAAVKFIHEKDMEKDAQIRNLSDRLERSETEVSSLRLNLTAIKSSKDEEMKDLEDKLLSQQEDHDREIEAQRAKIYELEVSVHEWNKKYGVLSAEMAVSERTEEDKAHQHRLEKLVEELEINLEGIKTENDQLKITQESMASELALLKPRISELEEKNAKLSNDLLSKDSDLSDLSEKLQTTEETYMTQMGELELEIEQSRRQLTQETTEKEEYQKELENLVELHGSLQSKYKESKKVVKVLEESLAAAKKDAGLTISQNHLRYYQELEKKYVQAKK